MHYRTLREAAEAENIPLPTIHKWVRKHDIARREGHIWIIDVIALRRIIDASRLLGVIK